MCKTKHLVFVFVVAFIFSTTAMAVDIAISTQANWWSQEAADREMQEIVDNVTTVSVERFAADQQDALADWVVAHTGDGEADLLILCGQFPDTIYEPGNAQADDSLAELFLDDGNTIINTGDYLFYIVNGAGTNATAGLQTMMDIAGITMWDDNTAVVVTADGQDITPSLVDFQTDRPFHLDELEGGWYAELVLAQNDAGTRADPVIVRNAATGGRVGIFYQTASQDDDPRGEVISEWINNWYLLGIAERTVLFAEDFEGLPLGPNVDEALAGDAVWTDTPPEGWAVDESGIPGIGMDETDGVTEWAGWAFTDKAWWTEAAGDQDRSLFELGSGTVAVADPDEWDDGERLTIPISADPYDTWLTTPAINISGSEAGTLQLKFDSSWRPEFDDNYHQTANITASFDGGDPVEVMLWESDEASANYKPYATNETVTIDLQNPAGAESVVLTFGLFDAGNDWWWAIDNVEISVQSIGRDPTKFGYEDPFNLIHTVETSESGKDISYTVDKIPDEWFERDITPIVVKEEPDIPLVPYVYHGDASEYTPEGVGSLDGTWSHDNGSDEWDGTGPHDDTPGGAAALFEDDVTFLRIQDTGDPRDYGWNDPGSNRKIYLTHAIDIGLDGVMLEFRARLATSPPLDDVHPDGGTGPIPWPDSGIGYHIRDNGKGMFGISDGVGIISFSLARAGEPGFESDVLVMNNLVGSEPSENVDTGDSATAVNTIDVRDVTQWNTFVIYIFPGKGTHIVSDRAPGTHYVSVSVNNGPAEIFEVTVGTGIESENPYISIGSSGTPVMTAFDVDYFAVDVIERIDPLLLEWLADYPDQVVSLIITLDGDVQIPRFPDLPNGVTRDSQEGLDIRADIQREVERLTAEQRVITEQFVSDVNDMFDIDLPIIEQFWLISGFLTELRLGDIMNLVGMDELIYIQAQLGGEPPPMDNNPNNDVEDGRADIASDPCFDAIPHDESYIGLLDTGILSTHILLDNPNQIGYQFVLVTPGCGCPDISDCESYDAWNHGTASAAIIAGNDKLGNDYRGVTAMTLDSFKIYRDPHDPRGGLDRLAAIRAFQCATEVFDSVIVGEIQAQEGKYGHIAAAADNAFDAGSVIIAANGNYGFDGQNPILSSVRSPASAHKVIGVGAYDIVTKAHYIDQGRGPTYDGRCKPDLQAPMNTETACIDSDTCLKTFDGTSGSTPYAAGAAALIRKWLVIHNTWDPGSVYAFLINSGTLEWTKFDNQYGVGPINLQLPVNVGMEWGKIEVSQGMAINLEINISSNKRDLHAALWWPENLNESHDDIDVYLIDPSPSNQVRAESRDRDGVFEFTRLTGQIIPGQWTVRIEAYQINSGPQTVYWVVAWHF
ncbi:MAG: S8 family peptidase [Planctomycetes bacterium]|nr:S8 family peptidase [Planctomycetota bacterium]